MSQVWDSREQLEAFGKRIMPLLADVELEHSGYPEISEVHNIVRRPPAIALCPHPARRPDSPSPGAATRPIRPAPESEADSTRPVER